MLPILLAAMASNAIAHGGIAQGYFANKSAKKAAKAQREYMAMMAQGRNRALALQRPYEQSGRKGLDLLTQYLTGNPSEVMSRLEQSPAYQFRLSQGQNSIQNLLAAKGGLKSGGAMKALTEFAQGTASQEFGNQVGYLQGLANIGQNAATAMSNAELLAGSDIANGALGAGMAMANRDAQYGNIVGNTLSQMGGLVGMAGMMGGGVRGAKPAGGMSSGGSTYNGQGFINAGMTSMGFN